MNDMEKHEYVIDPFACAFLENKSLSMNERIALGMLEAAKYMPIDFPEKFMLPTVKPMPIDGASTFIFGDGLYVDTEAYDRLILKYPQYNEKIKEIRCEMEGMSTSARLKDYLSPHDFRLREQQICWGGVWSGHCNISFGKLPKKGTDGIRAEITQSCSQNPEKSCFYHSCEIAMNALDILGDRVRELALKNAEVCTEQALACEWERIADTFSRVPRLPASDFYEAVMVYWLLYTVDGVDSPGRFDMEMIEFYRASPENEAKQILRRFLEGMHHVRGWNLCISGSDENGNDETNELSYAILSLVTEMGYQTPNLTMRVHKNTPEKLWEMAAESISTGIGLPAIYNDEVVCRALEKIGIPKHDSHDYCMNGCNQIDIMGKSHMGLEDGEVNLAKALELTLHNGYNAKTGGYDLISIQSGDPCACNTYEEFSNLYFTQLRYIIDAATCMSNKAQEVYAHYAPNPLRSCFLEGCLEKGLDYKNGGPLYGHGQILAEGIADTVDSLYAIKKLIFEDRKYKMAELISALTANFVEYEQLHHDFKCCSKFGNDIEDVDALATEITDYFFAYLKTKKTFRGGIFTGGCSTFNRSARYGAATAALPNGKCDGESTFADSIAATPGRDINGPTASIKSMLHYNQTEACSGFVAQMKFDKTLFSSESGRQGFIMLAKAYFANGGQQLSVNVLDSKVLAEARKNPELYGNLVVRVGGYSDYFCNLTPELQQNIIDRSVFSV